MRRELRTQSPLKNISGYHDLAMLSLTQKAVAGACRGFVARALSTTCFSEDRKIAHAFKGVVFGHWGVVATPQWSQHEEEWEAKNNIPVGTFRRLAGKQEGAMCDMLDGTIGTTEGGARLHSELSAEGIDLRALSNIDLTAQIRHLFQTARVNGDLRDALQCLRFDGYQTGLICREWHGGASPSQKRSKSEFKGHFNTIIESKAEKMRRTDPALYLLASLRADVLPHEMIYVDSRPKHLDPAKEVGMTTVLCAHGSDCVKKIEALIDLPLTNFAWSRDVYAKVLWVSNKDCERQDIVK